MLIADCMTRHPVMALPTMTASEAQKVMTENHIRHLPVVESGKRLAGLVTVSRFSIPNSALGSLDMWAISRYLTDLKVAQIMIKSKDVITIAPSRTAERAAAIMSEHKIGCLPVVEDDQTVVGMVTEIDLLRVFQEMLGLAHRGVRVTVRMPNRKGELGRLMAVLAERQWGVWGIGTYPARNRPEMYDAVVKIADVTQAEVWAVLNTVSGHEIVDIREVV